MTRLHISLRFATLLALGTISPVCWSMGLVEAFRLAIEHDPAVPLVRATLLGQREESTQLRGTLLPSVGLSANGAYSSSKVKSAFFGGFSEEYPGYDAGISARQALFRSDWFARRNQADALDKRNDIQRKDYHEQLLLRVAERYFGVLVARDDLALAEAEARAIHESLEDTRKRFEVGLVPGTDLKEAQARDDLAKARLITAREAVVSAQDALHESTHNGNAALPTLPADVRLPALDPADAETWVEKARGGNASMALAQQAVAVAESVFKSASAASHPNVDAVASYQHSDTSESQIGSERDDGRIAVELTLPLYNGGINQSRKRQAAAELDAARADAIRINAETERAVRQAFRQLQSEYAQAEALALAVRSATAAEEATRNGYNAGTRTITDVLNARSAVAQARRDLSRTRYELLLHRLRLRGLTGELADADFEQIDSLLKMAAAPADAAQ